MLNKKREKKKPKSRDLHLDALPDRSSASANPLNPKPMPL